MHEWIGRTVTVYADPISRTEEEGKGTIVKIIRKINDQIFYCEIKFEDGNYNRMINRDDIVI